MKAREYNSPLLQELLDEVTPLEMEQTNVKMQLASNIENLIRSKGWSKTRFASELNKTQPEISKWLSGAHNFTTDTLTHIAYVLEVEVSALYDKPKVKVVYQTAFIVPSGNSLIDTAPRTPINESDLSGQWHLNRLFGGTPTSINTYCYEA